MEWSLGAEFWSGVRFWSGNVFALLVIKYKKTWQSKRQISARARISGQRGAGQGTFAQWGKMRASF